MDECKPLHPGACARVRVDDAEGVPPAELCVRGDARGGVPTAPPPGRQGLTLVAISAQLELFCPNLIHECALELLKLSSNVSKYSPLLDGLEPPVISDMLLDTPGLLFFTTYTLLVLFWAEIYHQARSLPTGGLRPTFVAGAYTRPLFGSS